MHIHIDSRHAFGVVHDFGMFWKQKVFSLPGTPTENKNGLQVKKLLVVLLLVER